MYAIRPVSKLNRVEFNGSINKDFKLFSLPYSKEIVSYKDGMICVKLLNQEKLFQSEIDWSHESFGRLWNYSLQYGDFLNQADLPVSLRENLIIDLYEWLFEGRLTPEPYTASLRIMNTVRFLAEHHDSLKNSSFILTGLHSELHYLQKRPEFHLLGNHLLENAFALLMGGSYLNRDTWVKTGKTILESELNEQILDDGAHFERSPMYHQIILFRILEAISYIPENLYFVGTLKQVASKMVSWIHNMTFSNGSCAHFNDSTDGQTYPYIKLMPIAKKIGVTITKRIPLAGSGFKKMVSESFELIADVGGIHPDYQPGHAHADSLSFILHVSGKPFIIDPAVSTYNPGNRRNWERSTIAHNTITIDGENSADVWGAFRVGRRPDVSIVQESKKGVTAICKYVTGNGLTVEHQRSFAIHNNKIQITDLVKSNEAPVGRLHFAPGVKIKHITENAVELCDETVIKFTDVQQLNSFKFQCNTGFNRQIESDGIAYTFKNTCIIHIAAG